MITWGITALNHGSSLAVFHNGYLQSFNICEQDQLDRSLIYKALNQGGPSEIFWYENPWLKKLRQIRAGQWHSVWDGSVLPRNYLKSQGLGYARIHYTPHHASHAAAGYYSSGFDQCAVIVLDAIGEFESATIWRGCGGRLKKLWSKSYPWSLGLFYSAFTQLIGFKPVAEENLLEELSKHGDPDRYRARVQSYTKKNLHRGVRDWNKFGIVDRADIAAAVQRVFEIELEKISLLAGKLTGYERLVYTGGCAMNSTANRRVIAPRWKDVWIPDPPMDAASAIGAVVYHTRTPVTILKNRMLTQAAKESKIIL
jgi:carbamoyltransferase